MKRLANLLLAASLIAGCTSSGLLSIPVSDQGRYQYAPKIYTVQKGDTLYGISWAFGFDYKQVAQWNNINLPYTIYVGQQIYLYPKEQKNQRVKAKPIVLTTLPRQKQPTQTLASAPDKQPVSVPQKTVAGKWAWPAQGKLVGKFSPKSGNKGIQIAGVEGSPVRATSGGQVVYAGEGLRGYGKLIIVKHSSDYISAYAHNKEILVSEGQTIASGQRIASMGQTDANAPMLHFEIRKGGSPVDPMRFLSQ